MEGKKSFVDELFQRREAAEQHKSDILSSIFPPHPTGAGKDSSRSDGNSCESTGKFQSSAKQKCNPVYLCELPESCLLSSSVYYGGRDDFISESSSTKNSVAQYNNRKDKEDVSDNADVATRGDWWQGSFYY